jgi:hypothetical protein
LVIVCVTSYLAVVALDGSDPLMGFVFKPQALADPTTIVELILDTDVIFP